MKTGLMVVVAVMAVTAAMAGWGYDYETTQRPLSRTVSVDSNAGSTDVFVHSQPYTLCGPDGTKNPIYRVKLLYVKSGESYRFVTAMPKDSDYRVRVLMRSIDGETDARLRERIAKEAKGDYSLTPDGGYEGYYRDLEILDPATARYESDRILIAAFVVTRFRGYDDDKQRFINQGKPNPRRLFNEFTKVEIVLPDHEYRYLWVPGGRLESKSSAWMLDPETDENQQFERLIQATFDTKPLLQVRSRSIPETIRIYCAHGLLWEGSWGKAGQILDPYEKLNDAGLLYQQRTNEQGDTYYEGVIPKGDGHLLRGKCSSNLQTGVNMPSNIGVSTNNAAASNASD